jgi:hypothetical protein
MLRRKKYTIEEVKTYIISRGGTCLSDTYKNNKEKLRLQCNVCNHIWLSTFKDIKIGGNWCAKCSGNLKCSITDIYEIAKKRNGQCLSDEYQNNKKNLIWKCNKCSCIWEARLDRIKSGTWCPNCRRSHGERIISDYLNHLKIPYKSEYILKQCKNQRLDFYIKQYNLAIEFDGLQHFQIYGIYAPDEKTLHKIMEYDKQKLIYCLDNKIRMLRISYDTKNVTGAIDYALQSIAPVIVTSWKYHKLLEDVSEYEILLTGVGKQ